MIDVRQRLELPSGASGSGTYVLEQLLGSKDHEERAP
jgi:hypothetical protein